MRVQDLMRRGVATVRPTDDLRRAAGSMRERGCGCVVVTGENARVLGILTDRDVCMAALRADAPLSRLRVDGAMSSPAFTCRAEDSIAEAERAMGQHQVRRLPVVGEGGRLVGILSLDAVAREAVREEDLIVPLVSTEEAGRTLGQISRPHLIVGDLEPGRTPP